MDLFLDFFWTFWILFKVTTKSDQGYYWTPKIGQNSIIRSFLAQRAKKASDEGRSPPQELEVGPRSGPYLLVFVDPVMCWNDHLLWEMQVLAYLSVLEWLFKQHLSHQSDFHRCIHCDTIRNCYCLLIQHQNSSSLP